MSKTLTKFTHLDRRNIVSNRETMFCKVVNDIRGKNEAEKHFFSVSIIPIKNRKHEKEGRREKE